MKSRHFKSLFIVTAALFAQLLLICGMVSCKKNDQISAAPPNSFSRIGDILGSAPVSGSIQIRENGNSLILDYNQGSKLVLIDRLPQADKIYLRSMVFGDLVISSYGVAILDPSNNTLMLLSNNDPVSFAKFQAVMAFFPGPVESEVIFGTTVVNSEKT